MSVRDVVQAAAGALGGAATYVEDVFSTYLYTGNGSTQTITNGIDLAGEGGMVWMKARSNASSLSNVISDTERGIKYGLITNSTSAQPSITGGNVDLYAFNSNGFSVGSDNNFNVNTNGWTFASWTFRKAPKFFDVVTYTGNGVAGRQIPHDLGSAPGCIIVKSTSDATDWAVYHRGLSSAGYAVQLNGTSAQFSIPGYWNSTAPTSTVFSVGNDNDTNASSRTYVAYLFAHDAGGFGDDGDQSIISCGTFGVSSGSDGVVNLGWEPQFVIIKQATTGGSGNWYMFDNMRGIPTGGNDYKVYANTTGAETFGSDIIDLSATGFTIKAGTVQGGSNYIYIAIRRGPMKTPESGTEVFAVDFQGTGGVTPGYKASFPVDMGMWTDRDGGNKQITSRLTNDRLMYANTTDAEAGSASYSFDYQNGFMDISSTDTTRVGWMFRRAPGFFDVVAYTGDSTLGRAVPHNLGVAPELMIVKNRNNTENWVVYDAASGPTKYTILNSTAVAGTRAIWANTAPTATNFYVGGSGVLGETNYTTYTYVAYLFATLPGVSKVGSYVGTSSAQTIDCGFSTGARFVLIKNISAAYNWMVFDTARGIIAGNDVWLFLNSTAAEGFGSDEIDPDSSGFSLPSNWRAVNQSGDTYIFLAIA